MLPAGEIAIIRRNISIPIDSQLIQSHRSADTLLHFINEIRRGEHGHQDLYLMRDASSTHVVFSQETAGRLGLEWWNGFNWDLNPWGLEADVEILGKA
jgi:hypothetical protein